MCVSVCLSSDFACKGVIRNTISINYFETNWYTNPPNSTFFTKASIIDVINFLIIICYFTFGNTLLRQKIGILMGVDPAPFFLQICFLFHYESEWLSKRNDGDLITINDGGEF